MAESRKVRETREKIRTRSLELLLEKDVSQITAKEVVESLGMNRTTFYLHYKSVYDVIQEVEDELFADLYACMEPFADYTFDDRYFREPDPSIMAITRYIREHRLALSALFGPHGDYNFQYHFHKIQRELIVDLAVQQGYLRPTLEYLKLIQEFSIKSLDAVLNYLVATDEPMSDEELALFSYRMMYGPLRGVAPDEN